MWYLANRREEEMHSLVQRGPLVHYINAHIVMKIFLLKGKRKCSFWRGTPNWFA